MQIVQKITILFIFFLASCTKDKVNPVQCTEEVTYEKQVKAIIDINCAYSGCHVQGFPFGDYTTYENMLPFLNSADFESQVITTRDMPPSYASGNIELTEEEIIILQCWIKDGYLETN